MKPIQAVPHRYATPKLPIIKEALDKLIETGQLVRVNKPTPLISNMVVRERPASAEFLDLLNRLSQHNLKFNTDKIKFETPTAPFMGHIVTPEGLKPIKEKATSILDMPQPLDKAARCRFLGTVTYVSKFCPNLSELVCPLRDLTHIKQDFLWSEQHSKAFTQAKGIVSKAPCLRYFDVNVPVILQVDASEYGLGAALLQPASDSTGFCSIEWQQVAFRSSSLSPTEQRYAQIEKETCYCPCLSQI